MTVDVGRVREEARGYVLSVRFDSPDVGQRLARLAKAYIALCDELDRTREQLREAREALDRIADSYPWEPYDERENVHDEIHGHPTCPTNRRIAREALVGVSEATP